MTLNHICQRSVNIDKHVTANTWNLFMFLAAFVWLYVKRSQHLLLVYCFKINFDIKTGPKSWQPFLIKYSPFQCSLVSLLKTICYEDHFLSFPKVVIKAELQCILFNKRYNSCKLCNKRDICILCHLNLQPISEISRESETK